MRKSFTTALALAAVLAASTPAAAAPARSTREMPLFVKIVQHVKRSFGIRTNAEPIVPIPAPTTRTSKSTGTGK